MHDNGAETNLNIVGRRLLCCSIPHGIMGIVNMKVSRDLDLSLVETSFDSMHFHFTSLFPLRLTSLALPSSLVPFSCQLKTFDLFLNEVVHTSYLLYFEFHKMLIYSKTNAKNILALLYSVLFENRSFGIGEGRCLLTERFHVWSLSLPWDFSLYRDTHTPTPTDIYIFVAYRGT